QDQPRLRQDLHPGADARNAGADEHQPEVAVMERFENALECVRSCAAGWRHGCFASLKQQSDFTSFPFAAAGTSYSYEPKNASRRVSTLQTRVSAPRQFQ